MPRKAIKVGGVTIQPGTKGFGYLHVGLLAARTEVRVPFQVLHGAQDGPMLCLEGTLHGWEPMGAEVIRRAMLKVDPQKLKGTIMCLPLANPFSVEFSGTIESAGARVNPADQLDMNRVWPGKSQNGWLTERMADVMWREVVSRCDYLVDYHDGTGACDELPVAFPHAAHDEQMMAGMADGVGGGESSGPRRNVTAAQLNETILGMAKAFGSTVIWWRDKPLLPAMISGTALSHGIATLVVETGGGGVIDETIDQSAVCTLNILKHLGMIGGKPILPQKQIMVNNYVVYRSQMGGFYLGEPGIKLGVKVKKGQLLGKIVDPVTSEVVEECRSPLNGLIISRRIRMPINLGGYIAHIADLDAIIWERKNA
jgi:predicted deacylase